jgi:molybdenum cofactor synthesis domain-containing protein
MTRAGAAAGIIIGNEVLTAKVVDQNGPWLISRLRERGLALQSLQTVPDEVDAIVEAVGLARRRARWVITSGGIGPTHDDVTVRAVALALGREVVRPPELVASVSSAWTGETIPAAALRLADAPAGSELWHVDGTRYPILVCDGVFMLPGVPAYFRRQLEVVLRRLHGEPLAVGSLFLSASEPEIASVLDAVALKAPHVAIGSYPRVGQSESYRVKLTVEHVDPRVVTAVVEQLQRELPRGCVQEVTVPASAEGQSEPLTEPKKIVRE